jgi:hypothetical protein
VKKRGDKRGGWERHRSRRGMLEISKRKGYCGVVVGIGENIF